MLIEYATRQLFANNLMNIIAKCRPLERRKSLYSHANNIEHSPWEIGNIIQHVTGFTKCGFIYTQLQIFRNTILKYSIQYISRMFKVVMLACISPLIYNYSRYFIVSTVHWMAYWIVHHFK